MVGFAQEPTQEDLSPRTVGLPVSAENPHRSVGMAQGSIDRDRFRMFRLRCGANGDAKRFPARRERSESRHLVTGEPTLVLIDDLRVLSSLKAGDQRVASRFFFA